MGIGITGIAQWASGSSDKDLYGSKPRNAPHINYTSSLSDAIGTNMDLLPSLKELGLLSTDALTEMLERAMPGFTGLRDSTTGILQDKLEGRVPRDVQALLERNAAEKGITLGTSGSQLSQFDTLRNLGLTSLAIQNEGLQQTSAWMAQNRGNAFDFTRMFLSKEDAMRRTEFNWNVDRMNELSRVAPDPRVRGAWDTEWGFIGQILSVYGGGAGYQQTYRPPEERRPHPPTDDMGGGGASGYHSFFANPSYISYNRNDYDLPSDVGHPLEY